MRTTKDKAERSAKQRCALFRNDHGKLRLVWIWLITIVAYYAWTTGMHALWHALLPEASTAVFLMVESIGLIAIALVLTRIMHIHDHHGFYIGHGGKWLLIGIGMEIATAALCLAFDSLRMLRPIAEPTLSLNQLMLIALILIEDLAAEMLLQNVLYCSASDRLRKPFAIALTAAAAFIAGHAWTLPWIGMINIALLSVSCCLLHDRWGLAASAGFGIGWAVASNVIFSEYGTGVWNIYHVSEPWLTGNGTGVFNGIIATAMLIALITTLILTEKKHSEKAH